MNNYKEKLRVFCQALQYPNVDEMIEKSAEELREIGLTSAMIVGVADATINLLLNRLKNKEA